ncbi:MAG: CCA tRNA nucleotidyltransferase [Sphingomonas sp.]|nr:CCA tRNA nucleotidyltransferase [Sphingomonas sp.]
MILPDGVWRRRYDLADLAALLGAADGLTRMVGGVVRDTLLGFDAADIDLATRLAPTDVLDRLQAAGIKAVPTGLAHGTVTAVLPGGPVEITTLRRDVSTDGRHATVAYTDDWREDAARRDFTINALYADYPGGDIHDYFGGVADLQAGIVRFIGDPYERIAEDHLRILRFFRFHARFGDVPDPAGLAACSSRARDLMALSRERIAGELLKLLVAPRALAVIETMIAQGIFAAMLPEISAKGAQALAHLVAREAEQNIAPSAIRRLAALIPADPHSADTIAARLKLSKADRKRLVSAVQAPGDQPLQALAYRIGIEAAIDRHLISGNVDVGPIIGWTPPRLPISGGALVERGIDKGPQVAELLRHVEDQWIAEGFPDAARVEAICDQIVDQAR